MSQAENRKRSILDSLTEKNRVYVSDLSRALAVSAVTIRKDLKELEDRGALRRVHGGAASLDKSAVETTLDVLVAIHVEEKRRIAELAYTYIADGDSVVLDASSTTRELVRLIQNGDRKNLTVITTAIQVSQALSDCKHVQVIQIGGIVRRSLVTVMGPMATQSLRGLHADKAFIGVNGIDPKVGLTTQNLFECEIKRHIIESSTHSFVLADASKMDCVALGVICPTNRVDFIVTDNAVSPDFVKDLEDSGVEVVIVP